jgi:hypothetical protein
VRIHGFGAGKGVISPTRSTTLAAGV